jgi:hypothetical protein
MARRLIEVADDLEEIQALACREGWSDGLPIVPPTEERVGRVLDYLGRDPDEEIAVLPPRMGVASVLQVAINAVMAGCLPEYVPVVIAAVEALADPAFDLQTVETDVNPVAPLTIVNGPVREALGMNWAGNALGQGNRANATIGRAVRLVLLNTGGAKPGLDDTAILGQPGKYVFCLAEDEAGNPWEPLHVERGLDAGESAVTVVAATGTMNVLCGVDDVRDMLTLFANAMSYMGSNNIMLGGAGEPLVILTRAHAELLHREGLSKADVKRLLFDKCGFPIQPMPPLKRPERMDVFQKAGWVRPVRSPDQILILVAGADLPNHAMIVPTYGVGRAVTRAVRSPFP